MWLLACESAPENGQCAAEVWIQVSLPWITGLTMGDVALLLGAVAMVFAVAAGFRWVLQLLGVRS